MTYMSESWCPMNYQEIRITSVREVFYKQAPEHRVQCIRLFPDGKLRFIEYNHRKYIYRKWELSLGFFRRFLIVKLLELLIYEKITDSGDSVNYWTVDADTGEEIVHQEGSRGDDCFIMVGTVSDLLRMLLPVERLYLFDEEE